MTTMVKSAYHTNCTSEYMKAEIPLFLHLSKIRRTSGQKPSRTKFARYNQKRFHEWIYIKGDQGKS